MKRVLIIEDDLDLVTILAGVLEMHGYEVMYLTRVENALSKLNSFSPDIILLDVMLGCDIDGFELARQIRLEKNNPIIFTTARDGADDLLVGLGIPNTDYIRKPYRLVEVTMRIKNLLAIQDKSAGDVFQIGSFRFIPNEQSLKFGSEKIHLSTSETLLMNLLCENIGKFVKRKVISKTIWGENDPKHKESTLNNIISNLRKYLRKDEKIMLESRLGLGIRLIIETGKV
jgi:DNA-binding response OmpR family regulator